MDSCNLKYEFSPRSLDINTYYLHYQGHVQVLMNMLHHNCTAQAALDAPRFCVGAGMPDNGEGDVV